MARTHHQSRRLTRFAALLGATATLLGPLGAPASAADACDGTSVAAETTLCGTTIIRSSETAVVDVVLPAPAKLFGGTADNAGIDITSTGRVGAVAIVVDSPTRQAGWIFGARTNEKYGSRLVNQSSNDFGQDAQGFYNLAPGRYSIYIVADDAPVEAVLTFDGLAGESTIVPTRAAHAEVRETPLQATHPPLTQSAAAVESMTTDEPLIAAHFVRGTLTNNIAARIGTCLWTDEPPPEADTQPLCPGAQVESPSHRVGPDTSYTFNMWGITGVAPAASTTGKGVYVAGAMEKHDIKFMTLWMGVGA